LSFVPYNNLSFQLICQNQLKHQTALHYLGVTGAFSRIAMLAWHPKRRLFLFQGE